MMCSTGEKGRGNSAHTPSLHLIHHDLSESRVQFSIAFLALSTWIQVIAHTLRVGTHLPVEVSLSKRRRDACFSGPRLFGGFNGKLPPSTEFFWSWRMTTTGMLGPQLPFAFPRNSSFLKFIYKDAGQGYSVEFIQHWSFTDMTFRHRCYIFTIGFVSVNCIQINFPATHCGLLIIEL